MTRLRAAMLGLSALGVGVAAYLTYVHYAGLTPVCATGGCEQIQTSSYALLAGVPVALLGLLTYGLIAGLLAVRDDPAGRAAVLGAAAIGSAFSAYLTYRELFTIKAVCSWCVASAVIMAALVTLATLRFVKDSAG